MARPIKWRKIEKIPTVPNFVPSTDMTLEIPTNILLVEELEAIRLKDYEGLDQGECAERMEVSRPTFQRILLSAREKIADSLIHGKGIHIGGGNYTYHICPVKCLDCGKEWMESYENFEKVKQGAYTCPDCGSMHILCTQNCQNKFCHRHCKRRGNPRKPTETI